ncbi:riboflavin biosynthesis protein RibBA [Methanobrevibacter cuticularis]|uniref:3,4-dihydroxy-2-butanone 4-phosphate synthase n=1 Tax=Methanobrevibacter cuticularis TaxID=47311 RepID=A0A166CSM9_9EURY|nr:3,4-dihydroxy-2-butanone-4-phosphate synthase [Methanobrevibacter cuticularis]KZX16497.1 riboflavin biosynthesis protein RibBA [Methanobrevibacter cuticularis]
MLNKALKALQNGEFILMFDDEKRESETDMIIGAEFVTGREVATMREDAGGLICCCIHPDFCDKLKLPFMTDIMNAATEKYPVLGELIPNDIPYDERSSFSIWANHRKTFTGITDNDRALTINSMAKLCKEERFSEFGEEFRSPGHVSLLRGANNLLKNRQGHTEIGLAMAQMAGITPVTVVCEMMDGKTGEARTIADAEKYAEEHDLVFLDGNIVIDEYLK